MYIFICHGFQYGNWNDISQGTHEQKETRKTENITYTKALHGTKRDNFGPIQGTTEGMWYDGAVVENIMTGTVFQEW